MEVTRIIVQFIVLYTSTIKKIFSETAWAVRTKYLNPPREGWGAGTKVCINDQGHKNKMATTPIYGKTPN